MGHSVLVVEGAEDVRALLVSVLQRAGLDTREATTGAECLAQVRESQPDLVVLDLGLPDADGTEVCRQLRAMSSCYVLMLSASAEDLWRVGSGMIGNVPDGGARGEGHDRVTGVAPRRQAGGRKKLEAGGAQGPLCGCAKCPRGSCGSAEHGQCREHQDPDGLPDSPHDHASPLVLRGAQRENRTQPARTVGTPYSRAC